MSKDIMSRELRATQEFTLSNTAMTDLVRSTSDANLISLYNHISEAIAHFGYSEMNTRQEERFVAVNIAVPNYQAANKEASAAPTLSPAARFNQKGSLILGDAKKSVDALIAAAAGADTKPTDLTKFNEFRSDFKFIMAGAEMRAADVAQVHAELDAHFELLKKGGELTVLNAIKTKMVALDASRQNVQRNANGIPAWKIACIAVFLGLAIFFLLACLLKGKYCNIVEKLAKAKGKTIQGLISHLC